MQGSAHWGRHAAGGALVDTPQPCLRTERRTIGYWQHERFAMIRSCPRRPASEDADTCVSYEHHAVPELLDGQTCGWGRRAFFCASFFLEDTFFFFFLALGPSVPGGHDTSCVGVLPHRGDE